MQSLKDPLGNKNTLIAPSLISGKQIKHFRHNDLIPSSFVVEERVQKNHTHVELFSALTPESLQTTIPRAKRNNNNTKTKTAADKALHSNPKLGSGRPLTSRIVPVFLASHRGGALPSLTPQSDRGTRCGRRRRCARALALWCVYCICIYSFVCVSRWTTPSLNFTSAATEGIWVVPPIRKARTGHENPGAYRRTCNEGLCTTVRASKTLP